MKSLLLKAFTLVIASVIMPIASAAEYIEVQPLAKVVQTPVASCRDTEVVRIPMITWSADGATVVANGSAKRTAKGSLFAQEGLNVELYREDNFLKQIEAYRKCETPFLRGTFGMVNAGIEVTNKDPRTEMRIVGQLSWSAGGDALVAKEGIHTITDLKGKVIVLQAYGPHIDYLAKVLETAGLTLRDVKIKWTRDLVGFGSSTPSSAFHDDPSVDAAFVISSDAATLTTGDVAGSEGFVKGAHVLLSTATANRIIADVYAVRTDWYEKHPEFVARFAHGLMKGKEALQELVRDRSRKDYKPTLGAIAQLLLDSSSPQAIADFEGLYRDAEPVGWTGNVKFFTDNAYPRNFAHLTEASQNALITLGLLSGRVPLAVAQLDYNALKENLTDVSGVAPPRFTSEVAAKVAAREQQAVSSEGPLPPFEVHFKPNQTTFPDEQYAQQFEKVIGDATTYAGAIMLVEGHTDPKRYLELVAAKATEIELTRTTQANRNLSVTRAMAVRDAVMAYAKKKGISLDSSQFTVIGSGYMKPANGKMCNGLPCMPKTDEERLANMRVEFRLIPVEAEAPLSASETRSAQ